MRALLLVLFLGVLVSVDSATEEPVGSDRFLPTQIPKSESSEHDQTSYFQESEEETRYIVFPGLDAAADEIAEWVTGFASPFNVYFGPKPYIVGWIGEGGAFGEPDDPDIGDPDYEEDDSDEDEDDEDDPDFDPEDFYPEKKNG